mmetsp:Transcript_8936/g.17273  ORF Transcript_8936/g.17273 Transcript_8936/m.17273 type:complete len:393 (+) Transcript_8936:25-1203(+)
MEEDLVLMPIVAEEDMAIQVPCDMPAIIFSEALNMPYYAEALQSGLMQYITANSIDIRTVFRVTSQSNFLKEVDMMMEGRDPSTNIRLFKAAIYLHAQGFLKISQIRSAVTSYTAMNREYLESGVPLKASVIMQMLRWANRFLPDKVLEAWLNYCKPRLLRKSKLMIWEFLFLYSNTTDRDKVLTSKLPKPSHKLIKEGNATYKMEKDLHISRVPDKWLQDHFDSIIDPSRIKFFALGQRKRSLRRKRTKFTRKATVFPDKHVSELKQILRSPSLFDDIKTNLKEARQKLKSAGHSRTSSTAALALPLPKAESKMSFFSSCTHNFRISPVRIPHFQTPSVSGRATPKNFMTRPSTAQGKKKIQSTCLDLPKKEAFKAELLRASGSLKLSDRV